MAVSLFKKSTNPVEFNFFQNTLDNTIKTLLSLYDRLSNRPITRGNHSDSSAGGENSITTSSMTADSRSFDCPTFKSKRNSFPAVCCTSNFCAKDKYIAVITIAIMIKFEHGSAAIEPQYYTDFKKISSFFSGQPTTTVFFDGYSLGSEVFNRSPLAHLRFKNLVKYLFDNFDIFPNLSNPTIPEDSMRNNHHATNLDLQDCYQVKFIFSYRHFSTSRYLFD